MWDLKFSFLSDILQLAQTNDTRITVQSLSKAMFGVHLNRPWYTKNHVIKGQVFKEIVGK